MRVYLGGGACFTLHSLTVNHQVFHVLQVMLLLLGNVKSEINTVTSIAYTSFGLCLENLLLLHLHLKDTTVFFA